MKNSIILVIVLVLALLFWFEKQSTTRGLAPKIVARPKPRSGLCGLLNNIFGSQKKTGSSGGASGGGAPGGSGAGTAGGSRSCNKTPGTAFCGCASCLAYAGKDANGNEIYQKSCGGLVYSDGSQATQADIACNEGACVGTVCNPPVCNPQCVPSSVPCTVVSASGGCAGSGCFSFSSCGCV